MPQTVSTPLHERFGLLGWLRRPLRNALFSFLKRVSHTHDAKEILAETLNGLLRPRQEVLDNVADLAPVPYPEIGTTGVQTRTSQRSDLVFITARFRSGSTLLWNLFRHLKGFTSYYEPLNERCWFDPARHGNRIDPTHHGVSDYWKEYEGLLELRDFYTDEWVSRNLLMDENAWNPAMKRYIEIMAERAPGRPVYQFNRIDFRLPWLQRNFPGAKIVHIYRHPRDQWCSSLMGSKDFPRDGSVNAFRSHDRFYLLMWARDLKHHFPFLDERVTPQPYRIFYYIWKLSYLFGKRFAHHSLAFEDLVRGPELELGRLFATLNVEVADWAPLQKIIVQPALGKWRDYADDAWFKEHESYCETVLADFFTHDRPHNTNGVLNTNGKAINNHEPATARFANGLAEIKAR